MSLQGFDEVVDCGAAMFLPRAEWRCWFSRRTPSDFVRALSAGLVGDACGAGWVVGGDSC